MDIISVVFGHSGLVSCHHVFHLQSYNDRLFSQLQQAAILGYTMIYKHHWLYLSFSSFSNCSAAALYMCVIFQWNNNRYRYSQYYMASSFNRLVYVYRYVCAKNSWVGYIIVEIIYNTASLNLTHHYKSSGFIQCTIKPMYVNTTMAISYHCSIHKINIAHNCKLWLLVK